jgi:hypothetical protein
MALKVRSEKNAAAVTLGRKGGKKGGLARAAKLTAEERSEIARKAVRARWDKANAKRERSVPKTKVRKKYQVTETARAIAKSDHSDRAVLQLLKRIRATDDATEIRKLTDELERVIFHKQYRTA